MTPRLSQHFLADSRTAARIADALRAPEGARVLEIGPGRGALTRHLLERPWRVTAVELDEALAERLEERWGKRDDFTVVRADALEYVLPSAPDGDPWWVIGNLPYAITSPLLFHLVDQVDDAPVAEMVFMIQKEVAERLVAEPGTKARGSLTVGIGLVADVDALFHVPPGRFRPPPSVPSTVVRLTPRDRTGSRRRTRRVRSLVQALFGQRRKQLQ
ncbi:MAG: 16S rRNA (adenine(1518)-N(6)/adenine(1519)-N(6))-dimethyltransferase RsmA, partial [Gemmatimonadota bacterium]|nr:16S rRNA (adenine(1518)-N(6)/adenine(1519)-N(6))-dimethyltransferase RsmA [Gemmatimonadota bacterium]